MEHTTLLMLPGMDELATALVDSPAPELAVRSQLCDPVQLSRAFRSRLVPFVGVTLFDAATEFARVLMRGKVSADVFVPREHLGPGRRQGQHHRASLVGTQVVEQASASVARPSLRIARTRSTVATVGVDTLRPSTVLAAPTGARLDSRTIRPADRAPASGRGTLLSRTAHGLPRQALEPELRSTARARYAGRRLFAPFAPFEHPR
jgi:hypothetical protein